jgi:hypothetical protein
VWVRRLLITLAIVVPVLTMAAMIWWVLVTLTAAALASALAAVFLFLLAGLAATRPRRGSIEVVQYVKIRR